MCTHLPCRVVFSQSVCNTARMLVSQLGSGPKSRPWDLVTGTACTQHQCKYANMVSVTTDFDNKQKNYSDEESS